MKAIQVTGYGGVEKLSLVDVPRPIPKAGQVLVQVKACGMNNTEIWMREGAYGVEEASGWKKEGVTFPRIPGYDVAGRIISLGEGVPSSRLGEDVVLFPFTSSGKAGEEHYAEDLSFLGSEHDGGYAEYVVWPEALCLPMPLETYEESVVFSVSGLTAWHMIEQLKLQKGQPVVITGANGGVGSMNVQIASKVFGAIVVALVGDLKSTETMKALGATHVLSYRSVHLEEDILSVLGGPCDAVLDVVGDALFQTMIAVLKNGGKLCISGSIGGQKTEVDLRRVCLKHITLYGSVLGTREEYQRMLQAISSGQVRPVIDRVFPLEEAAKAQKYFKEGGKMGKILLRP